MRSATILMAVLILSGCRSAHEVAVSSYRAATAPVNVVRQEASPTTAGVTMPPQPGITSSDRVQPTSSGPPVSSQPQNSGDQTPRPVSSPKPGSGLDFPTAKPVEGKPGYVYSPFDPGKYVDVSGYAPGSKVKDPYSGKIFLVP